jgi:hypothetical protein
MMKKIGITFLFLLICVGASLVLMNVFNEATEKIKEFYHVENPDREWVFDPTPWSGGSHDRRLDEPIVGEKLPWFVDPFSGEDGSRNGFMDTVKKYGVYAILSVVFLFWYIRYKKKKRKDKEEVPSGIDHTRYAVNSVDLQDTEDESLILSEENLNEIRQMLKEWESHLNTLNRKRTHETIQEWFKRINGPTEIIPVYEKVRYGRKPFNHKELHLLKKFLNSNEDSRRR